MTTAQLVRRYLSDTQTEIVVYSILTSILGIIFAMLNDSASLLFSIYLVGIAYMSMRTLDVQKIYMPMFNIMPIHAKTIVTAHYSYYFSFCSIFGLMFVILLIFDSIISQQFSLSLFIGMLLLALCMTLFYCNIFYFFHYRFQNGSNLFLIFIILLSLFGGFAKFSEFLQSITYTPS